VGQRAALYCRVSTADQSCDRQEHDLRAFAKRSGFEIVGVYKEKASGAKTDRIERKKVMALAQAREIEAILVTELSRWGRSTHRPRADAAIAAGVGCVRPRRLRPAIRPVERRTAR
jgi:putative DNA-invertase from lambdoid prophage Rac